MRTDIQPIYAPPRAGDVRDSLADISLAKAQIGYQPKVFFAQGLRQAIDWYTKNL